MSYTTFSDRELVDSVIANDPRAMDELVHRFARLVRHIGRNSFGLSGADLDELEQSVSVHLLRRDLKGLRSWRGAEFKHYIAAITRNASIDILRRKDDPAESSLECQSADVSSFDASVPFKSTYLRQVEKAVADFVAQQPSTARQAFYLSCMSGRSQKEIAAQLGISQVNAGVIVHRTRRALNKHLEKQFGKRPLVA